ncbi:MAG: hypothetical protein GEU97_05405 [Actinophytocola sp.]|nr:hypothetical protein [Actinophytocola sp.]
MSTRKRSRVRLLLVFALVAMLGAALYSVPALAQGPDPTPTHGSIINRLDAVEANLTQQHDALAAAAREPINLESNSNIDEGGDSSFVDVFTVPDDKWLVLEYVSFRAFVGIDRDRLVSLRVITTAGDNQVDHRIDPSPLVSAEIPEQEGGELVKIYAQPGSTLTYIAERGCCGDRPTVVSVGFSGYLTEQP